MTQESTQSSTLPNAQVSRKDSRPLSSLLGYCHTNRLYIECRKSYREASFLNCTSREISS